MHMMPGQHMHMHNGALLEIQSQLELISATLARLSERMSIIERQCGKISEIQQSVNHISLAQTEAAHARV